jgi:AAHS family 4-hydroxybenzoate transporter-like MFS transporter
MDGEAAKRLPSNHTKTWFGDETMARTNATLEIRKWIDEQRISALQLRVLLLCFIVVAVDGYDTACVGFIAPALSHEWNLSPSVLGMLFGAGLLGLMAGALCLGPLADRIGRRKTLIATVGFFGVSSLVASYSASVESLTFWRFVTGLGLGAAMPNAIALTSEYCPDRKKAFLTTVMFCGFTLGSGLGGLVAANFTPIYGWRSVLLVGGVLPVTLCLILLVALPESVRYLVLRRGNERQIASILGKIAPLQDPDNTRFTLEEVPSSGSPVKQLFAPEFRTGTLLLWTVFFMSLLIVYLMTNWLPTLIQRSGLSLAAASKVAVLYQVGGTVGALIIGRLMDLRSQTGVLTATYAVGAAFLVATGLATGAWLPIAVAGVGFCISGSQIGANAYVARYYPTANRVTGVSWALGVGRLGSVVGATVGGQLLVANISFPLLFLIVAGPALIASFAIAACGRHSRRVELRQRAEVTANIAAS